MDARQEGNDRPSGPSYGSSGWEEEFRKKGRIWGDTPGELAGIALALMKKSSLCTENYTFLDLGCGYGRDSLYIARNCRISVYGIDTSATAIETARESAVELGLNPGMFNCGNFLTCPDLPDATVVYSSNVYQVLGPDERAGFRDRVRAAIRREGVFFMSTLSVDDPEHAGKGTAVAGEANSIIEPGTRKYLHLCTREELARDFAFLKIADLSELEYIEPRTGGDHHHRSWILTGYGQENDR